MIAGGLYGYSLGKTSLPWYCPFSKGESAGPVITKCHSRMLLGLPATRACLVSSHALAWDFASAHLGSATTFGTGSLPSRWYSFCSRDRHALDAPPMPPRVVLDR